MAINLGDDPEFEPLVVGDDDFQRQERERRDATREALRALSQMPETPMPLPPSPPGQAAETIAQAQPGAVPFAPRVTPPMAERGAPFPQTPPTPPNMPPVAPPPVQAAPPPERVAPEVQMPEPRAPRVQAPRVDAPRAPSVSRRGAEDPMVLGNPARPQPDRGTTQRPRSPEEEAFLNQLRGARNADAVRRIFHALGSGLRAAAGSQPLAFRSEEQGVRDRYREDMDRRREALRDQEASRRADIQERRQARQDGLLEQRESRESRIADARQRLLEAQSQRERDEAMRDLMREDPASGESQRARQRYLIQARDRERLLPQAQRRTDEQIMAELQGMSAADIEAMERRLGNIAFGARTSRAGGGSGGGVRAPGREGISPEQARQERIQAAIDRGMDPAVAEEEERQGRLSRTLAGDDLTRGVQTRSRDYGLALDRSGLLGADSALREVEQALARYREGSDIPGYGQTGMAPELVLTAEGRELRRLVNRLLDSTIREASGAGTTASEEVRFRNILGVTDQSSDDDLRRAMREARSVLENRFNSLRGAYGQDAVDAWERQARETRGRGTSQAVEEGPSRESPARRQSGESQQPAQSRPPARRGYVWVRAADGTEGQIPQENLQEALRRGARRL